MDALAEPQERGDGCPRCAETRPELPKHAERFSRLIEDRVARIRMQRLADPLSALEELAAELSAEAVQNHPDLVVGDVSPERVEGGAEAGAGGPPPEREELKAQRQELSAGEKDSTTYPYDDLPGQRQRCRSQTTLHRRTLRRNPGTPPQGRHWKSLHAHRSRNASRRRPLLTDRSIGQGLSREMVRPEPQPGFGSLLRDRPERVTAQPATG